MSLSQATPVNQQNFIFLLCPQKYIDRILSQRPGPSDMKTYMLVSNHLKPYFIFLLEPMEEFRLNLSPGPSPRPVNVHHTLSQCIHTCAWHCMRTYMSKHPGDSADCEFLKKLSPYTFCAMFARTHTHTRRERERERERERILQLTQANTPYICIYV